MIKSKAEMKILIVDGHETSRHVIAILLHKLGYNNVLEAGTKHEAEKIVQEHTRKNDGMNALMGGGPQTVCDLDLIILDKDVKPDNGIIYLAQLRQRFDAGSLPILYTAMKDGADELSVASSAGANDTLVKPFTHDKLSAKIEPMVGAGKAPVIQSFSFGGAGAKKEEPVIKPVVQPSKSLEELRAASEAQSLTEPSIPSPSPLRSAKAEPLHPKKKRKEKPKSKVKAGGSSFQRRDSKKVFTKDDPVTATLKDGKIDSHYHVEVDIIGGGENCFWAKQEEGESRVKLYYLTAKGQSTGMEAKEIDLDDFMHTFYLCEEYGCSILDRLKDN